MVSAALKHVPQTTATTFAFSLAFIFHLWYLDEEGGEEDEGHQFEPHNEHDGPPEGHRVKQDSTHSGSSHKWTL